MALTPRATHVLQWHGTECSELVIVSESQKTCHSSDWGLQLDPMKLESLVIAYQP